MSARLASPGGAALVGLAVLANVALAFAVAGRQASPPGDGSGHVPRSVRYLEPVVISSGQAFNRSTPVGLLAVAEAVDDSLARGDLSAAYAHMKGISADLDAFLRESLDAGRTLSFRHVSTRLHYRGGVVADFVALARSPSGDVNAFHLSSLYAFEAEGAWTIAFFVPSQRRSGPSIEAVEGDVWVAPERAWFDADLVVDIDTAGHEILFIGLPALRSPRPLAGAAISDVRLVAVTQGGVPCDAIVGASEVWVRPASPGTKVRLRLRYQGTPAPDPDTYMTGEKVFLSGWMPWIARSVFAVELRVHYPRHMQLASGAADHRDLATWGSWRTSRLVDDATSGVVLAIGTFERQDSLELDRGHEATVYAYGRLQDGRTLEASVRAAVTALAPIGDAVTGDFAIVVRHRLPLLGQVSDDMMVVDWSVVAPPFFELHEQIVAHEIAHFLFGARVHPGSGTAGRWWEAVAEYVSTWVLDEADAEDVRRYSHDSYAGLRGVSDVAIASEGSPSENASRALSYGKGSLIMSALELEIGRDGMIAFLRELVERYRGKAAGWDDLVAVLGDTAGADAAAWLRLWIDTPGAPDLELAEEATLDGERVRGALVQTSDFHGHVELGVYGAGVPGERELFATHLVAFAGPEATIDIPAAEGARWLVLDPRMRMPRRVEIEDGEGGTRPARVEVEIGQSEEP